MQSLFPLGCRSRRFYAAVTLALVCALLTGLLDPPDASAQAAESDSTVLDKGTLRLANLRFDNFLGIISASLEVRAGQEAGIKFFVEGFSREERMDSTGRPEYRVQLDYSIEIQDPEGVLLQPATTGEVETVLSMKDDDWRPSVEWSIRVPETAPTGRYPVVIRVNDRIGGVSIREQAALRVHGLTLKRAGGFEILGLEFAPSEDGPWRPIWYFELRSPVYVRYRLTGFAADAQKRIQVDQDWTVVNEEGEEVISKPAAISDESADFYVPRYIQSQFSISLRDPEPGDYRVRVDAHDRISGESATAEARFVLRP